MNALAPPIKGEIWVADTVVKGLGIRLWATKSGGQAAFAIRLRDKSGVVRRKTFDPQATLSYRLSRMFEITEIRLGDMLSEARDWARDEIAKLRGRPTRAEREQRRWRRERQRTSTLTFGQAAQEVLGHMRSRNLTQTYTDRLDKLFDIIVSAELRNTMLSKLDPTVMASALIRRDISPGNIRTIRSFIGQMSKHFGNSLGGDGFFADKLTEAFWKRWESHYDVTFPELRSLKPVDYERLFAILEEDGDWQQSLCIRLFFEFGAPMSRLMAAQWAQILDEFWYPYWPGERVLWFEARERIGERASSLLERLRSHVLADSASSRYWFPPRVRTSSAHIKSVDAKWRGILHVLGSPPYPLRHFALSYRSANNPSYLTSLLRQYGHVFREVSNADRVSKVLTARKNQ